MSEERALRKVTVFTTEDPKLQRSLNEAERNTDRAVRDIEGAKAPKLSLPAATKRAEYTAKFDELVRCDPSTAGFTVVLPKITRPDEGRTVVVKNTSASVNVITIRACGGQTVDGAASTTIAAAYGVVRLIADGRGNWCAL